MTELPGSSSSPGDLPWTPGPEDQEGAPFGAGRTAFRPGSAGIPTTEGDNSARSSDRGNLRGTANRDAELEFEREQNRRLRRDIELLLDKLGAEQIKSFSVRELTGDFMLYHGWRKALASALLKTGIGTIAAEKYMMTVSARTEEELKHG